MRFTHTHTPKTKKNFNMTKNMCNTLAVAQGWSGNIPHSPTAEKQGWSRNNDPSYLHYTHCIQKQWPILITLHSLHPETMTHLTHTPLIASRNNDPSYSHSTHCIQKQWPLLLTFHSLHPETMTHLTHTPLIASGNLSLIHIWRCRRDPQCRSRWSPYH